MAVGAKEAAQYLRRYVEAYRRMYDQFTASPPLGGGYPRLLVSPYLTSPEILCYVTPDGAVIADHSWQPEGDWYVAGGPALMVDFPETRTPPAVTEALTAAGILGKDIGISRLVAKGGVPEEIWNGDIGKPIEIVEEVLNGGTRIIVRRLELGWKSLIERLTFGAFCFLLDIHLQTSESDYWTPHIIRDLGFLTADRERARFYHYLELLPHVSEAAWDPKAIATRVRVDVRRAFAFAFSSLGKPGGTISLGTPQEYVAEHSRDRTRFLDGLSRLAQTVNEFATLLDAEAQADEKTFHDFLIRNPILLDVYGEAFFSKPRLEYPEGESPTGKAYVEPDLIIRQPGNLYRLVELERPSKSIATKRGETRAEVSQAAFQIAEWKTYIAKHYELLRDKFPGISVNQSSMIVISRSTQSSFGIGRDMRKYMEVARQQYNVDDVFTYDDLLARARQAYNMLSALGDAG